MNAERVIVDVTQLLAAAFGGHSQYSPTHVGEAIAGRIINGGYRYAQVTADEYAAAFRAWWDERWSGVDVDDATNEFVAGLAARDPYRSWHV